jgi:hypothetical protein
MYIYSATGAALICVDEEIWEICKFISNHLGGIPPQLEARVTKTVDFSKGKRNRFWLIPPIEEDTFLVFFF